MAKLLEKSSYTNGLDFFRRPIVKTASAALLTAGLGAVCSLEIKPPAAFAQEQVTTPSPKLPVRIEKFVFAQLPPREYILLPAMDFKQTVFGDIDFSINPENRVLESYTHRLTFSGEDAQKVRSNFDNHRENVTTVYADGSRSAPYILESYTLKGPKDPNTDNQQPFLDVEVEWGKWGRVARTKVMFAVDKSGRLIEIPEDGTDNGQNFSPDELRNLAKILKRPPPKWENAPGKSGDIMAIVENGDIRTSYFAHPNGTFSVYWLNPKDL